MDGFTRPGEPTKLLSLKGEFGGLRGRPRALSGQRLAYAREIAASGASMAEIAATLLVGRSTVYRTLQAERRAKEDPRRGDE